MLCSLRDRLGLVRAVALVAASLSATDPVRAADRANQPATSAVTTSNADPLATRWQRSGGPNCELLLLATPQQASAVAAAVESCRQRLQRQWRGAEAGGWSPRCEVVVHRARADYLAAVGPGGERTHGSSLVCFDQGRITKRRIDLDGTRPRWLEETLPHEMTHVVLADEFPHGRLPRWADEGAAMLADSVETRRQRRRALEQAVQAGQTLPLAELLSVDSLPRADRLAAFYGQSAELVDYLLARGDHRRFVAFLHHADLHGYDASLKAQYGLDGAAALSRADLGAPPARGAGPRNATQHQTAFAGLPSRGMRVSRAAGAPLSGPPTQPAR